MNPCWMTGAALLLDRVIGDPLFPTHPVILMGRYIAWFDRRWNRPERPGNRWVGMGLVASGLVIFGVLPALTLWSVGRASRLALWGLSIWLISTTIAWKGLVEAGRRVRRALADTGLSSARTAVAQIVGRDTETLSEEGVIRAAVETLAENLVDAIVAPVLFACVGGAPLALAYRWVNTLDAMVGHRTPRYRTFGWASARLDDLLNWVPARLTVILMLPVLAVTGLDPRRAWRTVRRDGRKHPSPNSGLPEATMAGGLRVQLGGVNYYHGVPDPRPPLGDPVTPLHPHHIERAIAVVHGTTALLLMLVTAGGVL
jgi:adenosylcobinamide-phosphate synthase